MIKDIFLFFIGIKRLTLADENLPRAYKVLSHSGLSVKAESLRPGEHVFTVNLFRYKRIAALFDNEGIPYFSSDIIGFPVILRFLIKRPGLLAGLFLFTGLVAYISNTVCSIELEDEGIPKDEIVSLLDEVGCGIGDYIPGIDFDDVQARFLAENDEVAWIGVNMKGNHANVEVLMSKHGEKSEYKRGVYANIVASEDAQIVEIRTGSGQSNVIEGDIVKKGDLLVSGVISGKDGAIRYDYAGAEVLAKVNRSFDVKIPFKNRKKVYTGRIGQKKTIKILKIEINLFKRGRIEYTTYDKIEDSKRVTMPGGRKLPVFVNTVSFSEYEYEDEIISLKEAESRARSELREITDLLLEDSEILSEKISHEVTSDEYVIHFDAVCLKDIAKTKEFEVTENKTP